MSENNRQLDPQRHKPLVAFATAVASIGVLAASAMLASEMLAIDGWFNPSHVQTQVGQQRTITLEDGSTVHLNTRSAITIHFTPTRREVRLPDGEARFTVASNPDRPFIVTTPQACLRAVGTVFNVQVGSHRTSVAVLEGHVRVFGRAEEMPMGQATLLPLSTPVPAFLKPAHDLYAGERAAVTRKGAVQRNVGPSIERVSAWTQRQLVFRDEPLADLVAEFNRYHDEQLRIDDAELAKFRVSGTFDAYDMNSLKQYLENFQNVHARPGPDGTQILTR